MHLEAEQGTEDIDAEGAEPITKFPKYIPSQKGKVKVPTDLDSIDNILITSSLPKGVPHEGTATGCILTVKFEDWDLANSEMFLHLEIENLMKQNTEGAVITLEP